MNVSLTPELDALVNDKVRSGLYQRPARSSAVARVVLWPVLLGIVAGWAGIAIL